MAGYEIGFRNQIGGVNWIGAEAEMGGGYRAGFLGVVDEIALRVIGRILADDLDGIFVGAYGAICA